MHRALRPRCSRQHPDSTSRSPVSLYRPGGVLMPGRPTRTVLNPSPPAPSPVARPAADRPAYRTSGPAPALRTAGAGHVRNAAFRAPCRSSGGAVCLSGARRARRHPAAACVPTSCHQQRSRDSGIGWGGVRARGLGRRRAARQRLRPPASGTRLLSSGQQVGHGQVGPDHQVAAGSMFFVWAASACSPCVACRCTRLPSSASKAMRP